jgi:hypothetical protein
MIAYMLMAIASETPRLYVPSKLFAIHVLRMRECVGNKYMGCTDGNTYTVLAKGSEVDKDEGQKNRCRRTDDRKNPASLFYQPTCSGPDIYE